MLVGILLAKVFGNITVKHYIYSDITYAYSSDCRTAIGE